VVVAREPVNYSTEDQNTLLTDTTAAISVIAGAPCDGYLASPPSPP
jgi:hypothetical protein